MYISCTIFSVSFPLCNFQHLVGHHSLLKAPVRYCVYRGLQGVTRGYTGLQEVTEGYRGLQKVTRGYRGLQVITDGYMGLQRVTECYRGLQRVRGG